MGEVRSGAVGEVCGLSLLPESHRADTGKMGEVMGFPESEAV